MQGTKKNEQLNSLSLRVKKRMLKISCSFSPRAVSSRVWNKSANITKSDDEERKGLNEEVQEIVIFPEGNVITSTKEEVCASR